MAGWWCGRASRCAPERMAGNGRIRLLIVDDHEMVRAGLRAMLAADPDLEVVADTASGARAVALARELRPQVGLLDARLPDLSGPEVCRRICADVPGVAVVMLTTFSDADLVRRCVHAGARGYLLKDVERLDLGRSIRALVRGEAVLDPKVAPAVLAAGREAGEAGGGGQHPLQHRPGPGFEMGAERVSHPESPGGGRFSGDPGEGH